MDFSKAFKANDVRGIVGKTINEDMFYSIGGACYKFFKSKKIIVGTDMRVSSPFLEKAFISGFTDAGGDVLDIGLVGTDVVYFASGKFKLPGVMITASHNPSKYNGIKFVFSGAKPVNNKNGLKKIQSLAEKHKKRKVKKGKVVRKSLIKQYIKHTHSFVNKRKLRKIRVVVDAGNGMAGRMVPYVYSKLPMSVIPMYFKLDGSFPHHVPNPIKPLNTRALQRRVKKEKADYGVEFDADTDRVYFIDERGRRVNSSIIAGLIIKHLFLKKPGTVVYSTSCSRIVKETGLFYGGRVFESRVGHTFVKKMMEEKNGSFGVEHSGHFYFKDNYNADSGMIASLLVYEIYSMQPYPFSAMVAEFSKYSKSEEISVKVKDVSKAMKLIEKKFTPLKPKRISRKDGLKMEFKESWFLVRPSNTEPVLRMYVEANTRYLLRKEINRLEKTVR